MKLSIVQLEELPQVEALIRLTVRESVDATDEEKLIFIENITDNLALWTAYPQRCVHLKATLRGRLAGVVLVKDYWNLCNLFVLPAHQGCGVGRALVEAAIDACRYKADRPAMRLNAARNAVGFYEAMGFRRIASQNRSLEVTPMEFVFKA